MLMTVTWRENGNHILAHQDLTDSHASGRRASQSNAHVQGAVENLDIFKTVQAWKTTSVRFSAPLGNAT